MFVDFEFSGMPQNIDTLKKVWYEDCSKQIGIGCINTKMDSVDKKMDVEETVKKVKNIIGKDNIIIDPDCGMRMLPEEIAKGKLEVIRQIRNGGLT